MDTAPETPSLGRHRWLTGADDGTTWTRRADAPDLPWGAFPRPEWPLPEGATTYCEAGGYAWVGFPDGVAMRAPLA